MRRLGDTAIRGDPQRFLFDPLAPALNQPRLAAVDEAREAFFEGAVYGAAHCRFSLAALP
jgi:hypothetical protein